MPGESMKTLLMVLFLTAGALMSGCATASRTPVLDPVGPATTSSLPAGATDGTLVVYSAYEVNADFNARDPDRPEYSDYKIFSPEGKLWRRIHNNSGTMRQDPVPVTLPPGKYLVQARANGYGLVKIPVVIVGQKTTLLHLEGGAAADTFGANATNGVCLPDGRIIGWKAAAGH